MNAHLKAIYFLLKRYRIYLLSLLEVLQGSTVVEALEPRQHSPVLRGFDEPVPVLRGVSMDGERQHPQLHDEEPRG